MKAKFRFKISPDYMDASVLIGRPDEDYIVTMDEILSALEEEGITFGILQEKLQFAVDHQSFMSEIPCARGVPATPGKDGELKFAVPLHTELRPRIREDGTADYHDMGLINEISQGRLLCRRTRPVPGVDGTDIRGNAVPFLPGIYPEFPAGEGAVLSDHDDTKLMAGRDGYVKFENGIISVPNVFTLNSDVNNGTGDVKFKGDIIINGCVREGFRVVSGGNITINGAVSGAVIIADGDVTITDGFTGMSEGKILSGGNIKSRYLQNMIAKCAGQIETEYALHSYLHSGAGIRAQGGRATIAGGEAHTCGSVITGDIGAETYVATKIVVDDMPVRFWDENYRTFNYDPESEDEYMEEPPVMPMEKDAKIVAKSCAFPETKLQIGMSFFEVDRELKCTKFEVKDGEITASPIF